MVLSLKLYVSGERGELGLRVFQLMYNQRRLWQVHPGNYFFRHFVQLVVFLVTITISPTTIGRSWISRLAVFLVWPRTTKHTVRLSSVSNDLIDVRDAKCSIERRTRTSFVV